MKIVFPHKINIPDNFKASLKKIGAVFYEDFPDENTLLHRIKDFHIVVCYIRISNKTLSKCTNLKYIIIPVSGYENIDLNYAKSKNIVVINCPTFNTNSVAEHAISLLMAANRNLIQATDSIRRGVWVPEKLSGFEIQGSNLLLLGYGHIGKRIHSIIKNFRIKVDYINSNTPKDIVNIKIKKADFLVICMSLTKETRHYLDKERLSLLKNTAILVNVSRGDIIDQKELLNILKNKKIRGVGLDVFENEPINSSRIKNRDIIEISKLPNVIVTPHIAYNTAGITEKQAKEIIKNIKSCISGKPINVVS